MAELHDALKSLSPVSWDDVPKDGLDRYLADCFASGELICNSLPPNANGTPFSDSHPHHDTPNTAQSHADIFASAARSHPPHKEHGDLQKNWGKPVKFKAQDNPLHVELYKMAGNDRHGAWFARRSVHEGLGFDKFKRAMMREFAQSMTVSGGPGAGAVRGLAADRRLERVDVDGVGRLEVYQLSAQFPGPVTPREFMIMLLESDTVLSDKSAAELKSGTKHVPRHYMVVSKPIEHPDAPMRSGYVRGSYESVELIREIPLFPAKASSTSSLLSSGGWEKAGETNGEHTDKQHESNGPSDDAEHDAELNPVEWTMITRSDPGGGIPRFLVERGTPEAMIGDIHKFFDWACGLDHIPHPDDDLEKQEQASRQEMGAEPPDDEHTAASRPQDNNAREATDLQHTSAPLKSASDPALSAQPEQGGMFSSIAKAIESGVETYAPASVSGMLHQRLHPDEVDTSDDSSDTSSVDSFLSAEELTRIATAPEAPPRPQDSTDALSLASNVSEASKDKLNSHEKEVQKLMKKREKLEQQLAKKRIAEETKLKESQEKEQSEQSKAKEEMEKKLRKTEEKHRKEMEKLEQKKEKEARKAEEKRKKKDEQNKLSRVTRERDEFRSQSDLFRKENSLLREQIADLQDQNTLLTQKLGKVVGGQEALKAVQEELARDRPHSAKSTVSEKSSLEKKVEGDDTGHV